MAPLFPCCCCVAVLLSAVLLYYMYVHVFPFLLKICIKNDVYTSEVSQFIKHKNRYYFYYIIIIFIFIISN